MAGPIALTGASGRLGSRVARRLSATGVPLRLVVRDPARAPDVPGASIARASFDDPAAVRAALEGTQTVLMVSAAETPARVAQHTGFVDAATAAGVRHLVYTSFYGAAPDCTFTLGRDHYATEEHIRSSGMRFTFLRDNLYADFLIAMVGGDDLIRGPAGDGRVAAVAQDDIAAAAAAVLCDPELHAGATYSLTGPEALSMAEVAATLAAALHRRIGYHPETIPEAYASRAVFGAPGWQVEAWVSTYLAIAGGELAGVTDDVPQLCGHPATSLAQLLARRASAY
jgi:uncharacterized protein YbjT (DUF2867 family)